MFKVLIVDDEIYVVALIQKLIDWDKFHMRVEATANDGITALQLVKEIKPDLVIVDVRMPGYDGISFMDRVREFNTNVRFIVISGHKQFDYAKGAMRNNAEDYLLKPINKEELENVLKHVYDELIKIRNRESRMKVMEEELDTSRNRIRESLVDIMFRGEFRDITDDWLSINKRFMTNFSEGIVRFVCLITDTPAFLEKEEYHDTTLKEFYQSMKEALKEVCMETVCYSYKNITTYLINYQKDQESIFRNKLREQMSYYGQKMKKFNNISICVCMGAPCSNLVSLEETVPELWWCILGRTGFADRRIIEPGDIRRDDTLLPAIWEFREEKFMTALEELNFSALKLCIKEMYSKAFYGIEENTLLYYELYMKIAEQIWKYFSNIGICHESQEEFKKRCQEKYLESTSYIEYEKILCEEIFRLTEETQQSGKGQVMPAIRIVKRYIAEHYQEEISLSTAAYTVNISPVYLSRLFKKEEGINFLDYLNQYRIDVAKKLLQDVQYNVLEAAEMAGFKNTRYFSKIFKKNVGITPSEYRKRHLGKDA